MHARDDMKVIIFGITGYTALTIVIPPVEDISAGKKLFKPIKPAISAARSQTVPKLPYFCMCGTWVHAENRTSFRSDGSRLPNPPKQPHGVPP